MMELFLSGGAGVIPAATVWPVLPKRLAALAPAPSAESIISCQPVSIVSISNDMNARPTSANSIAAAPDVLRAFIWRTLQRHAGKWRTRSAEPAAPLHS